MIRGPPKIGLILYSKKICAFGEYIESYSLVCRQLLNKIFILFRCLESSDFQPSLAKKFIDQRFVLEVYIFHDFFMFKGCIVAISPIRFRRS